MGLDRKYMAIPDSSKVFELVTISPDHGEALEFLGTYYSGEALANACANKVDGVFYKEAQKLKQLHPGIEQRTCSLDRWWDMLHFLLSEDRRKAGCPDSNDFGTIATRGERDIHRFAVSTQGVPIRHVSASMTATIAPWLDKIENQDLQLHYNPDLMREIGVYKFYDTEDEFAWICKYFASLKNFYKSVAEHNEGVLVITD